ncbi:MAG: NUDIX domain-containing protein [Candidatus Aenigmatarchaeota archaeon]
MKEYFQVVDRNDRVIGKATRERCHSSREIIHRAVAVVVLNKKGEILLEKRSLKKDMEPGKWGLVAGHVSPGESYEEAAVREIEEEIGIKPEKLSQLFKVFFRTEKESEIIKCFSCVCEGPFKFNREEMDEVRFFSKDEVKKALEKSLIKITESDTIILKRFLRIRQ